MPQEGKESAVTATRVEQDSLGPVNVPADKLWGAQTQRSLEHFSIGDDLMPREMIPAYAFVKVASRVAKVVFDSDLARVARPADCEAFIRSQCSSRSTAASCKRNRRE